ncbi:hypothetical protein ACVIGB_006301 [Bradyrhizobium sp. USDA 4341]
MILVVRRLRACALPATSSVGLAWPNAGTDEFIVEAPYPCKTAAAATKSRRNRGTITGGTIQSARRNPDTYAPHLLAGALRYPQSPVDAVDGR